MSSRSSLSIVEYFAEHSGYKCGYCKQEDTNFSHGMWGHTLTTRDYQDLIDRGWRRSGQYCYKPTMARTCCPLYTIKCQAVEFKPSKSQKKVMKKFVSYILNDKRPGTGMSEPMGEKNYEEGVEDCETDVEVDKGKGVEKKLGLENLQGLERLTKIEGESPDSSRDMIENRKIAENSKMEIKEQKLEHLTGKLVSPPKGMDPTKPKQMKAKLARREKWEKKVKEGGKVVSSKKEQHEKTVEELLDITKSSSPAHKFTKRLVKSDESDPEFISSFSESLLVYQKYQMAVHGDREDKCTDKQFRRFLCTSPLQAEGGQGSFHLQYLLDGKIVAVGVIDILPHCVSSVYLYYDPAFHFLSLGTLTSLMEISLVRELARTSPAITNYYLGFYIHNCIKMRYKGKYFPSFLCCPETYTWHPLASCVPLLDLSPYSRLDRDMDSKDRDRVTDIRGVGVLHCRQATTYQVYQEMVDEQRGEDDREEVEEYSMLVGDRLARRMLLYRS